MTKSKKNIIINGYIMGLCRLGASITPAAIFVFNVKLFNFLNIYTIKTLTPRKTAVLFPGFRFKDKTRQ